MGLQGTRRVDAQLGKAAADSFRLSCRPPQGACECRGGLLTHENRDGIAEQSAFGQDLWQVAEDRDAGDEVAADVIDHIHELGQTWGKLHLETQNSGSSREGNPTQKRGNNCSANPNRSMG